MVGLARKVFEHERQVERVLLKPRDDIASLDRWPRHQAFTLSAEDAASVAGRHVLVVDDTWGSGAKSQSASLALKAAGAARVTVLCVARWLSYRWDEHRRAIDAGLSSYDAMACPVGPGACMAGALYG